MQQITLINNLTNYDPSKSLVNLMVSLWFTNAKAKVDKSSNETRKKKWAKLDPFEMSVLIPTTTKGKYYLIDRPAALLLAHTPVPYLTWARFFAWLNKTNPPGTPPNDVIKDMVNIATTTERVEAAISDSTTWSGDATCWKTVDQNKNDVILITGKPIIGDEEVGAFIQQSFLQNFQFESAVFTQDMIADDGTPEYFTGKLELKDNAFPESDRSKTIYVVNMGLFKPDDETDDSETDNAGGDDTTSQDGQTATEDTSEQQDAQTPSS